jgi:chloramphenicol 3-O phosphotransferase
MRNPSDQTQRRTPIAILVNGPSSSGKSTLCRALQDRLIDIADGNPDVVFARVAFDDLVLMMSDKLFPISFVQLQSGDLSRLVSRSPFDGRAGWEYVDDSNSIGQHGGSPRVRIDLSPHVRQLLHGLHRSWAAHLELGTNLIIDHFIQDSSWCDEVVNMLKGSGARIVVVGVHCSLVELERRESSRADGKVEGRPLGLARRSDELCHAHPLAYDITVHTDQEPTAQSVESIVTAMQARGLIAPATSR